MNKNGSLFIVVFSVYSIFLLSQPVSAQPQPYTYRPGDRGQFPVTPSHQVQILPDRFLREFDPVTVFFSSQIRKDAVGPEDHPEKWITMQPKQPGEYRWIDDKTLEFRPTIPWPPISSFTITVDKVQHELKTLLATPTYIVPSQGTADLSDVNHISLTFAYPVAPALLKKLISFEVTSLPGIDRSNSIFFGAGEYTIKTGEQQSSGEVTYIFQFKKAFPLGHRVRTHVLLSTIPEFSEGKQVYWFDTKSDFQLLRAGTYSAKFNIGSDGSHYTVDQALAVDQEGQIVLEFSSQPQPLRLSDAKSLFTFSPAPRSFSFSQYDNRCIAKVDLEPERLYKVYLQPIPVKDLLGRPLLMKKPSSFYVYRNPDRKYIRWTNSYSILERYGPQHLPLTLANINAFDLRIYRIDPLHKAFFPFPESPVMVSESNAPPGPGEEPADESDIHEPLDASAISDHIKMLGSPHYSEVIDVANEKIAIEQTLDCKQKLEKIAGKEAPGTYLIGFRDLSGDAERTYVKVCVTDLSLSTVESKGALQFTVTSLATGKPINAAEVTIEGLKDSEFKQLRSEKTDASGMCAIPCGALYDPNGGYDLKRVIVKKDNDVLVLDSREYQAPPEFADNHWQQTSEGWLSCLTEKPYDVETDRKITAFVFPERPMYRPEEHVFIKGYVRSLFKGQVQKLPFGSVSMTIASPDNEWNIPITLSEQNTFNYELAEDELVTGEYTITVTWDPENDNYSSQTIATAKFRVDAYRIPRFEVKLNGPDQVPNDRPFTTNLVASYYAGGKVIDCRVNWQVRVFPYTWSLNGWDGYALSSDSRFSQSVSSTDQGTISEEMKTDAEGGARLVSEPSKALGGNPAKYIIEATVTDVDEQTVTDVQTVVTLPPFVLAVKTDRYVTGSSTIKANLAALSPITAKPLAGQAVKATLKKMSWYSYLQETDFARSDPQYITEENTVTIEEQSLVTGEKPLEVMFRDRDPGVYILEFSSTDKLGRLQTLRLDLFLAGKKPVTWQKSQEQVFETVTDKQEYVPGDVAKVILKSPYQNGSALAIVENADGKPVYSWVTVKGGQAEFSLPIDATMTPKIPVSFLLMRPRISDVKRLPTGVFVDAGKPESVANTTWLTVKPVANQVTVSLQHPKVQTPGDTMTIAIALSDWKGKPLSGEVTLWLVDEAVLSLGEEMDLYPVPAFLNEISSYLRIRDTRNLALGRLRDFENPGGDEEQSGEQSDVKITVRKNFKTVPFYNPSIMIDGSGHASVKVPLPDNLTRFAIRAVVASGIERFGCAKSMVAVRLPIIVEPLLPRFVRVGDRFTAGGIARIVEGEGGEGKFSLETEGLAIASDKKQKTWYDFTFPGKKAQPVFVEMTVPTPKFTKDGKPSRDSVALQMAVTKRGSNRGDAFRVTIPLLADRAPVTRKTLGLVKKDSVFTVNGIKEQIRDNTLVRQLLISNELPLLAVLGGLRYLIEYPHGCTEQKVSRAYPSLVYQDLWRQLGLEPLDPKLDSYIKETLLYLEKVQDENGLFGYWPGGHGTVHLTAYAAEFLTAVKKYHGNGSDESYGFNDAVYTRALDALERSLRSDYTNLLDGYGYFERCAATYALVNAGRADMGYLKQLAYHAQETDAASQARIFSAIVESGKPMDEVLRDLEKELWKATVFKLNNGKEAYGGLQQGSSKIGAVVHSDEINTLACLVGALSRTSDKPEKVTMMANELVSLGGKNGWGNTHTNGLALLALHDRVTTNRASGKDATLSFTLDGKATPLAYSGKQGMLQYSFTSPASGKLECTASGNDSFYVKLFERYLPAAPGSQVKAKQEGFVVKRQEIYPSSDGAPSQKFWLDTAGQTVSIPLGRIVEEHVQVTNSERRYFVAVIIPLAAGVEYLNPELKTASSDFAPAGHTTNSGSYASFNDDKIVYYFNTMDKGTYDFYFRVRATTAGTFTQPPAQAEMMYDEETYGNSTGATVVVSSEK